MNGRKLTLVSLVLAPVLAAGLAPGDKVAFDPGRYTVLSKSFAEDTTVALEVYEILMDGSVISQEDIPGVSLAASHRVSMTDEYLELADGRPTKLQRTFDEIGSTVTATIDDGAGIEEHEATGSSELAEAVVAFTWDPEEESFDVAFEEGDTGDEAHLAGLVEEADFRGFLPGEEVAEGDTWDVKADALSHAVRPGGDLWVLPDDLGGGPFVNIQVQEMLAASITSLAQASGEFDGEIKATYRGSEERDGVQVGVIGLQIEVSSEIDRGERLDLAAENVGAELDIEFQSLSYMWAVEGDAELAWDLENGHFRTFSLEADVTMTVEMEWTQPFFDEEIEMGGNFELGGTTQVRASVDTE